MLERSYYVDKGVGENFLKRGPHYALGLSSNWSSEKLNYNAVYYHHKLICILWIAALCPNSQSIVDALLCPLRAVRKKRIYWKTWSNAKVIHFPTQRWSTFPVLLAVTVAVTVVFCDLGHRSLLVHVNNVLKSTHICALPGGCVESLHDRRGVTPENTNQLFTEHFLYREILTVFVRYRWTT